jgi:hypothetical protein
VDAADYAVWRQTLDSTIDLRADGNGNGVIDLADYNVWRSTFGNSYGNGVGLGEAVPEPSTLVTVILAGSIALATRRRSDV